MDHKQSHRKAPGSGRFCRVGSLSNALSTCHPAQIGNPITYKGIRKVLPAESIYPIPIVIWKSKILRVVLFQELLFKTMQCLFRGENQNLKIWVGFKNNNCASKKEFLKKHLYASHMFLIFITLAYLNKYVDPNNCSLYFDIFVYFSILVSLQRG